MTECRDCEREFNPRDRRHSRWGFADQCEECGKRQERDHQRHVGGLAGVGKSNVIVVYTGDVARRMQPLIKRQKHHYGANLPLGNPAPPDRSE